MALSAADIPVVISHHKASGTPNHGLVKKTLVLIDEARKTQKLGLDVYPYVAASTMLDARRIPLASKIIVTWSKSLPEFAGQTLDAIATKLGCDQTDDEVDLDTLRRWSAAWGTVVAAPGHIPTGPSRDRVLADVDDLIAYLKTLVAAHRAAPRDGKPRDGAACRR